MLSILIPTYNYSAYPLAFEIHQQCTKAEIEFEIIVLDDCSTNRVKENDKINELKNSSYTILKQNIGRSAIRNKLAEIAKYSTLLFLDVDTIPVNPNFITSYLKELTPSTEIIYGGILYKPEKPEKKELLRWKYGNAREALSAEKRNTKPYISFLTLNFIIKKTIFKKLKFNEDIPNYRCEDTLYAIDAKELKLNIQHSNNPVYHLGLDTSLVFIKKTNESIDTYIHIVNENLINSNETYITRITYKLHKFKITYLIALFYNLFNKVILKNMTSNNPSLFLFDIYRLGYFSKALTKIR